MTRNVRQLRQYRKRRSNKDVDVCTADGDTGDAVPRITSPTAGDKLWERLGTRRVLVLHYHTKLYVAFTEFVLSTLETAYRSPTLLSSVATTAKLISRVQRLSVDRNHWQPRVCQDQLVQVFSATLTELSACGDCGISSEGIRMATRLTILKADENPDIDSVEFCAGTLTDLSARGRCGLATAGIETATFLTKLNTSYNGKILSVKSCGANLTQLTACGSTCGLTEEGIRKATRLTRLKADYNPRLARSFLSRICEI